LVKDAIKLREDIM